MSPRRGLGAGAIIAIIVAAFLAVGAIIGAIAGGGTPAASSTTAPPPDPFDRAAFDAYWAGPGVTDATRQLVTRVDWNGTVLTAHTSLHADSDARDPAIIICGALSGYWNLRGEFHAVRVVDGADQVLVSRNSEGQSCIWRR